jgi:hypothetical protein
MTQRPAPPHEEESHLIRGIIFGGMISAPIWWGIYRLFVWAGIF